MKPYIYIRTLKHAEHTVFCVQEGQKAYFDPLFNRMVPYSSGQQIKRCILTTLTDDLNVPMAPITFNYNITKKDGLENKETWAPCDPRYIDQLIGGWMRAGKDMVALKRRSPLLGGLERDKENITFDRSDRPEWHPVNVRIEGSDRLMTKEEIEAYLQNNNRTLTKRIWIPDNTRGLFVADMAIDLRALFCVTTNQHEPELSPEMSLMETLALAVSDNANHIAGAIRTKLIEEGDKPKAKLIIDETAGAEVFVTLPCASYVVTVNERATALEEAEKKLTDMMMAFDYENQ